MSIASSKRAMVLHAGWIVRFLPSAGVPPPIPASCKSRGLMSVPPATTTASAFTRRRRPERRRAETPRALPATTSIPSTRAPVTSCAPRSRAAGT